MDSASWLTARVIEPRFLAETAVPGAVATALGIKALRIGTQIDPGVPGTVTIGAPALALALKSGNFGGPDFFEKALSAMP